MRMIRSTDISQLDIKKRIITLDSWFNSPRRDNNSKFVCTHYTGLNIYEKNERTKRTNKPSIIVVNNFYTLFSVTGRPTDTNLSLQIRRTYIT